MNNKVWTYVIGKNLETPELEQLLANGKSFVTEWTAHENRLEASFEILQGHIVIVKVNEDINSASGCSIDKLLRFMKEAGKKYGFDPLDRFLVAYKKENTLSVTLASKIKELLQHGDLSENTIVYNTAVADESELQQWEQPLKNTWLSKYL